MTIERTMSDDTAAYIMTMIIPNGGNTMESLVSHFLLNKSSITYDESTFNKIKMIIPLIILIIIQI